MWTMRPVCFRMWSSVARHSFEKSSKPWKLNEQELTHAAKIAFWESEVVDIPECTSINSGGEVELDADPVVVVVLVLSDLGSRESNTHTWDLGLTIGQGNNGYTARASNTHKCSQPFLHTLNYVV